MEELRSSLGPLVNPIPFADQDRSSMNSKPVLVQLSTTSSRSSYSSLSSEDVTFDHTASPSEAESGSGKERTLGLRQLASMALSEGKPSTVTSEPPPRIELRKALGPEPESAPFAKDVKIKGWKTVGGKSWTDRAKVGAYVGRSISIAHCVLADAR